MPRKQLPIPSKIPPHFHAIRDDYNGGFRLHTYGDGDDRFDIISLSELETIEKYNKVEHLGDDDYCRYCDAAC